jgi:hypothetical protein
VASRGRGVSDGCGPPSVVALSLSLPDGLVSKFGSLCFASTCCTCACCTCATSLTVLTAFLAVAWAFLACACVL